MTSTEDQLRDALALLEQRAPHMSPSTSFTEPTRTWLSRRRWVLPLASAAAVIVVLALAVALSRMTSHHSPAGNQKSTATANPDATTCLQNPAYRQGADTTLVPGRPSTLTICQYPKGPKPAAMTTTDTGALVEALNALPATPMPVHAGCHPRYPGALPARGTYELHFRYDAGPDVLVNVLPECRPSINNTTSLEADDPATVLAVLNHLTGPRLAWARACVPRSSGSLTLAFDGLTVAAARARAHREGEVMDFLAADESCDIGRIPITAGHTYVHAAIANGRVVFARVSKTHSR
jgi:hypothetical protein